MSQKRRKNKKFFIVFEGLSGTGKTTIAKKVAKKMGAVYYKTPSPPFSFLRDKIDRHYNYQSRFLFYLASIVYASEHIKNILKHKSVICDRYILTTVCFHRALGVDFNSIIRQLSIIKPDLTFLITCSEKKRHYRLNHRGLTYNDKMEVRLRTDKKFLKEYKKFPMINLDNSGSIEETLNQARKFINKKLY